MSLGMQMKMGHLPEAVSVQQVNITLFVFYPINKYKHLLCKSQIIPLSILYIS